MADDDLGLDDNNIGSAPVKKGGLGGILPNILKWVVIAVGAVILIGTVSFVVVKIYTSNSPGASPLPVSETYKPRNEALDWYSSIEPLRVTLSNVVPANVMVQVQVVLGYKKDDKAASAEISARIIEIRDFLRRYFTSKTVEELRPMNEDKLRIEIRNAINDDILSGSKIRDVRFLTLEVIEQ